MYTAETNTTPNGKKLSSRPEYVEEYKSLVSWAYRRPARLVRTPAIVRHLGFWIGDLASSDKREALLEKFGNAIQVSGNFELETPFILGSTSLHRRYQACRLKGDDWQGLPIRITLELHHEYLTVSTIIELGQLDPTMPPTTAITTRLVSALAKLKKALTDRHQEFSSKFLSRTKPQLMRDVRAKMEGPYQDIFIKIWDDFYQQILAKAVLDVGNDLGHVFADFRGFIVSWADPSHDFFQTSAPPPAHTKSPQAFKQDESVQRAHAILPFMTAEPEAIMAKEEKELTVSRFLDGRCIYASTLGAQPPESIDKSEQPITYIVLSSGVNSWQTGRLVDRVHALGTLRLAARRYLNALSQAGDDLHELEKDILNTIDAKLPRMIVSGFAIDEVIRRLSVASSKLLSIRQSIPGGLPYRVERSRYYRSQFKSLVEALRIGQDGRIEGFQPYDEFVERRFGSAYEFIDMVGKRYDRLEHQLSDFYQRVRTAEASRLQKQITRQTGTIERLQEVAEIGFFVILFPYYLAASLVHVCMPLLPLVTSIASLLPGGEKGSAAREIVESVSTLLSFILGVSILVYLKRRRRERKFKLIESEKTERRITLLNLAETQSVEESEQGGED